MYAKIRINGDILVKTGMHIGGSSAFAAIGAVDSPIVRDVRSNLPLLPGSSLKGKMRSLLAKEFNESLQDPDNDHERIVRLFGSAKKGNVKRSRLLFSDMVLANEGELRRAGLQSMTEVKFENSISRLTAVANPRQIERAVRGSIFELDLIYEVEDEKEMINNVFEFNDKVVSEVMKHRTEVFAVEINSDVNEILDELDRNKYSRVPVYEDCLLYTSPSPRDTR